MSSLISFGRQTKGLSVNMCGAEDRPGANMDELDLRPLHQGSHQQSIGSSILKGYAVRHPP